MQKEQVILCVDDEKIVLHGLFNQLSRSFSNCTIECVQSGAEAIEVIKESLEEGCEIPLIISDQVMPKMKGHELLREVQDLSPQTYKILLTGYSDIAAIEDAINNSNLYRYITKPWNGDDLKLTVGKALDSFEKDVLLSRQKQELETQNVNLEQVIKERTKLLEREKEQNETLLRNILPNKIAKELKENGYSEPRHFESATILFTDFVGFTRISKNISPNELVSSLNECFIAFDEIIDRHNLEKIKTIGDSYMSVGGIPDKNETNALDAVFAAWEMIAWIKSWNERRIQSGLTPWPIRIGIHTGELIAGVIGKKKFSYDVWGDAVNIASSLESNSEPNRINISSQVCKRISEHFKCSDRGVIEIKNHDPIKMHFVESIIN